MSTTASGSNNATTVYVDLSTYDEIEELLYAGSSAANIFHARITKCIWFGQIPIRLRATGTRDFGQNFNFTQPRHGDYATYTWARITLPALDARATGDSIAWADNIGNAIFRELIFSVNDVNLQKYGTFYLMHRYQHSVDASHLVVYNNMIGNKADLTTPANSIASDTLDVPLWAFYQKNGAAFPHSCVPYADIRWEFTLRDFNQLVQTRSTNGSNLNQVLANGDTDYSTNPPSLVNFELWTNYVLLTQDMRSRMGAIPRQMLIDQVQETATTLATAGTQTNIDVRFSYHMVWLTFVGQNLNRGVTPVGTPATAGYQWTNYTDNTNPAQGNNPISNATVLYENSERLDNMPSDYYAWIVPFFHFEAGPFQTGYNTWCLAYFGNSYNPTGGLNASRMFNMSLTVLSTSATSGTFKLLVMAQVKQIILFSGGGIIVEFH